MIVNLGTTSSLLTNFYAGPSFLTDNWGHILSRRIKTLTPKRDRIRTFWENSSNMVASRGYIPFFSAKVQGISFSSEKKGVICYISTTKGGFVP